MVKIQDLPSHILEIIYFLRLTDRSQRRLVCSEWHSVITKRVFIVVLLSHNLKRFLELRAMDNSTRLVTLGEGITKIDLANLDIVSIT